MIEIFQSLYFWSGLVLLVLGAVFFLLKRWRAEGEIGFWEMVKNPSLWNRFARVQARQGELQEEAENWSREEIEEAVEHFLWKTKSSRDEWQLERILWSLGSRVDEFVLDKLANQSPYEKWVTPTGENILPEAPFHRACSVLSHDLPEKAVTILEPFLQDSNPRIRLEAASVLAEAGLNAAMPLLTLALQDEDEYVRSHTLMGLQRALERGKIQQDSIRILFPCVAQLLQEGNNGSDAAKVLIGLDSKKASALFQTEELLNTQSRVMSDILEVMTDSSLCVERNTLLQLIEQVQESNLEYPQCYQMGALLRQLGQHQQEQDKQLLKEWISHENEVIARGAASGFLSHHGMEGFEEKTWGLYHEHGLDGLNKPQQVYVAVSSCDMEVKNGGFAQYFLNSSGDDWPLALAGFEKIEAFEHQQQLQEAIALFPESPSEQRELRQQQLAKLCKKREDIFEPIEERYFDNQENLEVLLTLYALENSENF